MANTGGSYVYAPGTATGPVVVNPSYGGIGLNEIKVDCGLVTVSTVGVVALVTDVALVDLVTTVATVELVSDVALVDNVTLVDTLTTITDPIHAILDMPNPVPVTLISYG